MMVPNPARAAGNRTSHKFSRQSYASRVRTHVCATAGFPAVNRTKMFHVKQFCPVGLRNRTNQMRQTSRRGGMTKQN